MSYQKMIIGLLEVSEYSPPPTGAFSINKQVPGVFHRVNISVIKENDIKKS